MKHLLSLETMSADDMKCVLSRTPHFKRNRKEHDRPLTGQTWAMLFSKSSTRTRVSFDVGIRELGGTPLFLNAGDIQLGRGEPIKDTARVLGRMIHGAVIRTYAQRDVEEFAEYSGIPTVNALTDEEHPCQILTDIFTFEEKRGSIAGKVVAFIGDGACNVPRSWIWAAVKLGFELRIAAPTTFQPDTSAVAKVASASNPALGSGNGASFDFLSGGKLVVTESVDWAATGADLLYTDVWVSMGRESEAAERLEHLAGFQINADVVQRAQPGALVMHCLPAYRGKEISADVFEANADTIFEQAENRLHVQKAILDWLVR